MGWAWCCTPLVPKLRRLRQVDLYDTCVASSRPARATQWDPMSICTIKKKKRKRGELEPWLLAFAEDLGSALSKHMLIHNLLWLWFQGVWHHLLASSGIGRHVSKDLFILCVMCLCLSECLFRSLRRSEKALGPLELKSLLVVSEYVGAGNLAWSSGRGVNTLKHGAISLDPNLI